MKLLPFVRIALFALLCCGMQPLQAAVGTIHSFEGDVRIASTTGDRAAVAGLELNEGDTVRTGADAWALLAMSDGASMTLRPQSQLRIDTYRYDHDGDPARNSSLLSLVKGAFRSVTGYIGRTNRDGYRITTPVATIGVRGTDHEPAHYPPPGPGEKLEHEPGTYDKVNDGESFIRHPKGEVAVKPGQHAFVHHNSLAAPRRACWLGRRLFTTGTSRLTSAPRRGARTCTANSRNSTSDSCRSGKTNTRRAKTRWSKNGVSTRKSRTTSSSTGAS